MFSYFRHIQKACKLGLAYAFLSVFLLGCGSKSQPVVQPISFTQQSVPFQNNECSIQVTLINAGTDVYTLAFLSSSFKDDAGHTHQVQLDQNQVIADFDPVSIGGGAISQGNVVFDLTGTSLTPPITASVVIVGISGSQVTNFVGDFTCE